MGSENRQFVDRVWKQVGWHIHLQLVLETDTSYLVGSKNMLQCCQFRKKGSKCLDSNMFG